ncbi:helix-turn-helix domain-containing protein [Rhodococcus sp. G-MC3]|uniref:PucR family transcriptional regulator n=1 Tax=Rhodococcus sp. G-MC3 TaxID=3046209 RepID=UPI0024B8F035|nr:helix-turn-helix domain-containing protein [Rhodococcus sp. G-MC3]MDJ0394774.1 helix-turn-helix domain-containing protein [Rhodococcus sp. G-MC3]
MTSGDLSTLADAVAAATGGAVSVMDPAGYVIAYSSLPGQPIDDVRRDGILGKRVPDKYMVHHRDPEFRASGTVRVIDVAGTLPRLAVAISNGTEHLGSIWSICAGRPVDPPDPAAVAAVSRAAEAAMARAAEAAVPLILARRSSSRTSRTHALLTDPDAVRPDSDIEYVVLAAKVVSEHPEGYLDRLVGLLDLTVARGRDSGCVVIEQTVFLLRPLESDDTVEDFATEADVVRVRATASFGVPITFGIGEPSARPSAARRQASSVLDVAAARTATYRTVEVQVRLHQMETALAGTSMSIPAVEKLLAHDAAEGTSYAETILALLDHESNVAVAANSLYLHANTFRYRVRRTKDLFGLDLDDADTRLLVWLILRSKRRGFTSHHES